MSAEKAQRLHKTFQDYVRANGAALRVFVDYKTGHASEAQVGLANRLEQVALEAHIAAMNEVGNA